MPSSSPVRRHPGQTRRRLLDAAIHLFAAHGYHAISVDQIVGMAGANKRMVYHYFGSKEEIFKAALHEVYGRIEKIEFDAVERGRGPRDKLTRLLENYFDFLEENPAFTQFLLWENLERGRHIAKQAKRLSKDPFFVQFRQIVADGMASGEFRKDLDVRHLLIHFIGLCFIYHSNRFSLSQALNMDLGDRKTRVRGLDQILKMVFEGIGGQPSESAKPRTGR
jgi:TetR/AcrR family transcriptional regulator